MAGDAGAAEHGGRPGYPWGQELRIRYDDAAGAADRLAPPRRRMRPGRAAAVAGVACGAAVIALLVARPDRPAPAVGPEAGGDSAAATQPQLRVEIAPDPTAAPPAAAPPAAAPSDAPLPTPIAPSSPMPEQAARPAPSGPLARAEPPAVRGPARAAAVGDAADVSTTAGPVRVFVHVTDPAQRPMADRIRGELRQMRVGDLPVGTPPVRIVAGAPGRTEVRCLKRADCPAARRVARRLAATLDAPVPVVDLSSTYERDRRVRPGSLELWLRL